jgi:mRNA interferase MazF
LKVDIFRGDVFYAELGPVVGSEQDGLRPVVILQNNTGNKFSPTVIVAAVTSRCGSKKQLPTHISLSETFLPSDSIVLLEQIRTIDKLRLKEYIGRLNNTTMQRIDRALAISLGMNYRINNVIQLSLCENCAKQFYNSPGYYIHRANINQLFKETCTYCGCRLGFDYIIISTVSRKNQTYD